MKIEQLLVSDIIPYEKNAKKHPDEQVKAIAKSIETFGFKQPLVVDKDNVLVIGHGRLLAAKKLGIVSVPVIKADDLTDEQIRAYRLADNKVAESPWDLDLLDEEMKSILDIDMSEFGFSLESITDEEMEHTDIYSKETNIPQYEPKGDEVDLEDLVDTGKTENLISEIDEANIPEEIKEFLREAAHRHSVFNYRNIAEYYAQADKKVQELMERSALVIIDIDDAIANGYVKLTKTVQDLLEEEQGEQN